MLKKTLCFSVFLFTLGVMGTNHSHAQFDMHAATNNTAIAQNAFITVTWNDASPWSKFNLYRKQTTDSAFPSTPLNGSTPIQPMTDCNAIQSIISASSEEWIAIQNGLSTPQNPQFNPCTIATATLSASQTETLQLMARSRWKIAVVIGQGYQDDQVQLNVGYDYQVVGVDDQGVEQGILGNVTIQAAGNPTPLAAPPVVSATGGDNRVLITWESNPGAVGYNIYRATSSGNYIRVNNRSADTIITTDLDNNSLSPTRGFIDFQNYDTNGHAVARSVQGVSVSGPKNGVQYFYQVAPTDLLGNEGHLSSPPVSAQPQDQTRPQTTQQIQIVANDQQDQLELTWFRVEKDIDGHFEQAIAGYKVFRYDSPDFGSTPGVQIGVFPQPSSGIANVTAIDDDSSVLRQTFGEKQFWYRIKTVDAAGNESHFSTAEAGKLNDIRPPSIPQNVSARGLESSFEVSWQIVDEPDVAEYLIYRSVCNSGRWVCDPELEDERPEECPDVFRLVAFRTQEEATDMANEQDIISIEDATVAPDSALCYIYMVKSVDHAQNVSGKMPPENAETSSCVKMRERTPPDPAVITGLTARNNSIVLEWVGPPVQDIAAYHVYRSDKASGPYDWQGGLRVRKPPLQNTVLNQPYTPPEPFNCDDIPIETNDNMTLGTFTDTSATHKTNYWYKVIGIDQLGNPSTQTEIEEVLAQAAPVSTFTYSTNRPAAPTISAVNVRQPTCALEIQWTPTFNMNTQTGFVVFRSLQQNGTYRQISPLIQGAQYVDTHIVEGPEYWYRVLLLDNSGETSAMSNPVKGQISP